MNLPTYSEAVASEIKSLRSRLETLEQTLCLPSSKEEPRKAKTSLPSWLNDKDLRSYEQRRAVAVHSVTKLRIESAYVAILEGRSASLKDCAREHRVSRSTLKTAFKS
jgi:hypothetical protein